LLGTGSRTAWFALLLAVGVASFVVVGRTVYVRTPERRVIAAALVSALAGAIAFVAAMTVMWGQSTFVQRRRIWDLVGDHISDSPIGGAGWGAFWYHPELHLDPLLQRGSAHGSIPELLLGGGVVALGLWLVVVAIAFTGVLRVAWNEPGADSWLWLAVVVFLLVENLTESFVLWFSYNWVLLVAASLRFGSHRWGSVRSPQVSGPAAKPVADGVDQSARELAHEPHR
jgi:O-antigen ligase